MKLILCLIYTENISEVIGKLNMRGFDTIILSSTGSFLKSDMTTLL